jgi:tetratricopeptide (TPR) repeat protein
MLRSFYLLSLILIITLSSVLAQSNKSARALHKTAEEALAKKQLIRSLEILNECLIADPYFYDAYYTRGLVREQLTEFEEALTDYNIYLERMPDHTEALFSRATLRYKLGQYELAKADFIRLLDLPSGETTTVFFQLDQYSPSTTKIFTTQGSNMAYILNYIGLTETKLKNYEAAIKALDSAISLNPKDADQLVNRGLAKENNQDKAGAIEDYQVALAINPEHGLARHNLEALNGPKGSSEESQKILIESIERNPGLPYAHAQLAYSKFSAGDFKGALEEYDLAIEIDSTDVNYLFNRGLVKEKLKDYEGSIADFTNAIALKPDYESAWLNRGNVLTKLNILEEAIEDYSMAIFYNPHYATAYYNRALNKNKLGLVKEACEDLKKAEEFGMIVKKSVQDKICKDPK